MNELSRTTVIDFGAAPARCGARAAPAAPDTARARNSRRVVMATSCDLNDRTDGDTMYHARTVKARSDPRLVLEAAQGLDVRARRPQARVHGVHGEMGHPAHRAPRGQLLRAGLGR